MLNYMFMNSHYICLVYKTIYVNNCYESLNCPTYTRSNILRVFIEVKYY